MRSRAFSGHWIGTVVVVLILASVTPVLAATSAEFIPLGVECGPAFFPQLCVLDMSGDARTLLYNDALWTEEGGMTPISGPPDGFTVAALSDDGSTVVGTVAISSPPMGLREEAAIWLGGSDWQPLGSLPGSVPCGTSLTESYDVSGNGSVVVGLAWVGKPCTNAHAFRWTQATGMEDMGALVPNRASRANGISADGNVVVGWSDAASGARRGAIWDEGGLRWFTAPHSAIGEAQGVSSDGSIVVGGDFSDLSKPNSFAEPWIWTEAGGVQSLGIVKAFRGDVVDGQHYARDVSDDGGVVVGQDTLFLLGEQWAWIWTPSEGIKLLQDYVRAIGDSNVQNLVCPGQRGIATPCYGWDLWNVAAVSNDGSVIVGTGRNPDGNLEAFMIKLH